MTDSPLGPTGPTGDPLPGDPAGVEVLINGRWPLILPEHRAARDDWAWWEAGRLAAMHHVIRPGDRVLDVGAEEGDFPALFATWGAEVTLVEPNPYVWPSIRVTFELNGLAVPEWWVGLLGTANMEPELGDDTDSERGPDGWPKCAHWPLYPGHGFRHLWEHGGKHSRVRALDWLDLPKSRSGHFDIITIDVEGGELAVLRGADLILRNEVSRPRAVFVSIHPEFMADLYGIDDGVQAIRDLMEGHGYRTRYIARDHEWHFYFSVEG